LNGELDLLISSLINAFGIR